VEIEGEHADAGTGTVPTGDGGCISVRYKDYVDVFSRDRAETLEPHRPIHVAIDLEPGFNIPYGRIYNLSEVELKTLKAYIKTNLANEFIQRSSSPAAAPILYPKKQDRGL
jgi:hypothetical protein